MKKNRFRDSLFLKRILSLLMIALILSGILTSVFYYNRSRPLLVEMKVKELLPQAEWIANRAATISGSVDPTLENLVSISYTFFSIWTFIFQVPDKMVHTPLPDNLGEAEKKQIVASAYELHCKVSAGKLQSWQVERLTQQSGEFLFVIAPMFAQDGSELEQYLGTVIMVQPLEEIDLGLRSLNYSLIFANLIAGLLLLIPVVIAAQLMVKPLNRIRAIALAVTQGDFSKKAEFTGDDEISDLARAMNHMSERLASSFKQLTLERNQLQEILDGISEGIVAVDTNCKVTQINDILWILFQRDPNRFNKDELLEVTGLKDLFCRCLQEGVSITETLVLGSDRKLILCQLSPLYEFEGTISVIVGLFRDVTESERLEQTRRDYIANVSHELRTPITAMRALLEPLSDGMVTNKETRQRYYGILLRETLRLSRLIDDMLELSRLQSGKNAILQEPVALPSLLQSLCQRFSLMADEHGISFIAPEIDDTLPLLWGNSDRIEQIIIIYFDNALKFTPINGQISFIVDLKPDKAYLNISDSGKGIKPEDLPHVFDRFYKADKAHNQEGTGLGLSIAKALAEQLGMEVAVTSSEGQGATFSLGISYASEVMRNESYLKDVFDSE